MAKVSEWDWELKPSATWRDINFRELFSYKDLLLRLVRRELLSSYQQTLLGPLWAIFQPLLTVFTYVLIFDRIIGLSTDGVPSFLFYLAGIILWNLFLDLFSGVSYTFNDNHEVFSKVYFPRLVIPLSLLLLNLFRFSVQLLLLVVVVIYFSVTGQIHVQPLHLLLAIPIIFTVAGIGFGSGLIFAVITTKYRDFFSIVNLFIRLLMFICPIFYSLAIVPPKLKWIVNINPLSAQFELFRYSLFGVGQVSIYQFIYSVIVMFVILISGVLLFNKMGDKLMDVV